MTSLVGLQGAVARQLSQAARGAHNHEWLQHLRQREGGREAREFQRSMGQMQAGSRSSDAWRKGMGRKGSWCTNDSTSSRTLLLQA